MEIVEKLNDLSSRMRSDASNDECTPDGIMGQTLNSYADEVDGLVKVAIEELRRCMVGKERECGNSAASREALTKILNLTNSLDEECAVDPVEIHDIAKAALAEPPRNCDIVPIEAREAAEIFHRERPCHGYCYETHDWLLAPATEQEGCNDGNE